MITQPLSHLSCATSKAAYQQLGHAACIMLRWLSLVDPCRNSGIGIRDGVHESDGHWTYIFLYINTSFLFNIER